MLERLGHAVRFRPEQTCCGQMHYNTGYQAEAMPMARRFVELFEAAEAVVVPSTSCVSMIRDHHPKMTGGDAKPAADVAELLPRVWEFSEFLTRKLGVDDVGAFYPNRVTYHASCHGLRNLCPGDPALLQPGDMPGRINGQPARRAAPPVSANPADAAVLARLIFRSLAAGYAATLADLADLTGRKLARLFVVGGGSRNELLNGLAARATELSVHRAAVESATVGNLAVQLAAGVDGRVDASTVAGWARLQG